MKIIRSNIFGKFVIYKNLIAHINHIDEIYKINSKNDLENFKLNIVRYMEDFVNIAQNIPALEKIIVEDIPPFLEQIQSEVEKLQSKDFYSVEEISHLIYAEKVLLAVGSTDFSTLSNLMKENVSVKRFLFRNPVASPLYCELFEDLLKEEHNDILLSEIRKQKINLTLSKEQVVCFFNLCDDYEIKFYLADLFNLQLNMEELIKFFNHDSEKVRVLAYSIRQLPKQWLVKAFLNENLSIEERVYALLYMSKKSKEVIDYIFEKDDLNFYIELAKDCNLDRETLTKLYFKAEEFNELKEILLEYQYTNPEIPMCLAKEGFNLGFDLIYYKSAYLKWQFDKIDALSLNNIIHNFLDTRYFFTNNNYSYLISIIIERLKIHPDKKALLSSKSKLILNSHSLIKSFIK